MIIEGASPNQLDWSRAGFVFEDVQLRLEKKQFTVTGVDIAVRLRSNLLFDNFKPTVLILSIFSTRKDLYPLNGCKRARTRPWAEMRACTNFCGIPLKGGLHYAGTDANRGRSPGIHKTSHSRRKKRRRFQAYALPDLRYAVFRRD
jgi:hypothetical protein